MLSYNKAAYKRGEQRRSKSRGCCLPSGLWFCIYRGQSKPSPGSPRPRVFLLCKQKPDESRLVRCQSKTREGKHGSRCCRAGGAGIAPSRARPRTADPGPGSGRAALPAGHTLTIPTGSHRKGRATCPSRRGGKEWDKRSLWVPSAPLRCPWAPAGGNPAQNHIGALANRAHGGLSCPRVTCPCTPGPGGRDIPCGTILH